MKKVIFSQILAGNGVTNFSGLFDENGLPVRGKQMSVTIKIIPVINDDQLRGIPDNTELESALAWELLTTE